MKQHPIDLLPEHLAADNHAAAICKRYIIACGFVIAMFVFSIIHAQLSIAGSKSNLELARSQANDAFASRNRAGQQGAELLALNDLLLSRNSEVLHLETTRVLASIVNDLPLSITLDDLQLLADHQEPGSRTLRTSMSGFAATDADLSLLLASLKSSSLCNYVSLEYTSQRIVRSRPAIEFQIRFNVDLDKVHTRAGSVSKEQVEVVHAK